MYIPSSFEVTDAARLHAFMRTHGFATLVTNGGAGLVATHLPILLDTDGLRLLGHIAKANPQWRDVQGESLVIFPVMPANGVDRKSGMKFTTSVLS